MDGLQLPPLPVAYLSRTEFDVWVGPPAKWADDHRARRGTRIYANPYSDRGTSTAVAVAKFSGLWAQRLAGRRRRLWMKRLAALTGKRLGFHGVRGEAEARALVGLWHRHISREGDACSAG